ncbi:MAG: hypothetical protein IPH09_05220 [bacterium]|nr:hypothetical protein [bacterium]
MADLLVVGHDQVRDPERVDHRGELHLGLLQADAVGVVAVVIGRGLAQEQGVDADGRVHQARDAGDRAAGSGGIGGCGDAAERQDRRGDEDRRGDADTHDHSPLIPGARETADGGRLARRTSIFTDCESSR